MRAAASRPPVASASDSTIILATSRFPMYSHTPSEAQTANRSSLCSTCSVMSGSFETNGWSAKSPRDLDTASPKPAAPNTLIGCFGPKAMTLPPAFRILFFSFGSSGLWSFESAITSRSIPWALIRSTFILDVCLSGLPPPSLLLTASISASAPESRCSSFFRRQIIALESPTLAVCKRPRSLRLTTAVVPLCEASSSVPLRATPFLTAA
mmetsp:Transcript_27189/g.48069  ORF Transcript_27189/g.48069 Transcript_27189/m.48069 type:complete len:210 (-) Transcript_27189:296-925(-)